MEKNINIRHLSFLKETHSLIVLAFPIIISQLAQIGMNLTDTIMSGHHSETSLAGVAVGSSIWVPSFLFMVGVLMAITPLIAQAWGRGDIKEIKRTFQQGFWLSILLGLGMMAVLQSLGNLFDFMEMELIVREQAQGYVFAVSFGLPALAMFQVFRGLNEGAHFTKPYMYVSLVAVIANIPLNYVFVYGLYGMPEMGGIGCGWATAIVMWVELLAMIFLTIYNRKIRHINWHVRWKLPNYNAIRPIIQLGFPIGIMLLIESSMFSLIALFLAKLGSIAVAGHQVAMSFISLLFMVPLSLSMALTIRCGYLVGKGQPEQAKSVAKTGLLITLLLALVFCIIILFMGKQIAALYTDNTAVQILAVKLLLLAAIFQFSDAVQVTSAGILRGYKDTRHAFYVVLIAYWFIGLPLGYLLGLTDLLGPARGAEGFWIGMIAGLAIASLMLAFRVFRVSSSYVRQAQTSPNST